MQVFVCVCAVYICLYTIILCTHLSPDILILYTHECYVCMYVSVSSPHLSLPLKGFDNMLFIHLAPYSIHTHTPAQRRPVEAHLFLKWQR